MKTLQTPTGTLGIVDVLAEQEVELKLLSENQYFLRKHFSNGDYRDIILPPGKWSKLGFKEDIKEEQAMQIVEGGYCSTNGMVVYKDYEQEDNVFDNALESFQSLCRANYIKED